MLNSRGRVNAKMVIAFLTNVKILLDGPFIEHVLAAGAA